MSFARHGTDAQTSVIFSDVSQFWHPIQVDQRGRLDHAKIHRRHKALTARQDFCIPRGIVQDKQYFIKRVRSMVFKWGWLHLCTSPLDVPPDLPLAGRKIPDLFRGAGIVTSPFNSIKLSSTLG